MLRRLLKRRYIDKEFFDVYDDRLVILNAKEKEIACKILSYKTTKSYTEELRIRRISPTSYGVDVYSKPSLDKIVCRTPSHSPKRKKRASQQTYIDYKIAHTCIKRHQKILANIRVICPNREQAKITVENNEETLCKMTLQSAEIIF